LCAVIFIGALVQLTPLSSADAALPIETPGCSANGASIDHSFKLGGDVSCGVNERWLFIIADDVLVDLNGFTVAGTDQLGFSPAIHAGDSDRTRIRNGTIRDFAQGVQMAGKDMVVDGLTVRSNTDAGIIATSARGIIRNSTIIDNAADGIFANASRQTVVSNVIADNSGHGVAVTNVGTVVEGNAIHGNTEVGIDVAIAPSGVFTATTNSVSDNGGGGIRIDVNGKARVTGNDVFEDSGVGIDVVAALGATVRGNTVSGDTGGINATAVDDAVVAKNRVLGGNGGLEWNGDDVSIVANRVMSSISIGIDYAGERGVVQGNRSIGNGIGIVIDSGSSRSLVLGNVAKGNDGGGIFVSGSRARIDDNVANGNGYDDGNPGAGLGIDASGVTDAVSGKNKAVGNDDPAQCDPATIC
jgi:parallel beta-helix repeat protein